MAGSIPIDEYQRWIPPRQAIERLRPVASTTVIDALTAGIRSGAIRAAAHEVIESLPDRPPRQAGVYVLLDPGNWVDQAEQRFWEFGSITVEPPTMRGSVAGLRVRGNGPDRELTGVRLDPVGLRNLALQLGASAPPPSGHALPDPVKVYGYKPPPPPLGANRGRPLKTMWEDLWAEIAAQIHSGELLASKQADIEKAMLDWAAQNEKDLGESTARERAHKLWELIQQKARKSRG